MGYATDASRACVAHTRPARAHAKHLHVARARVRQFLCYYARALHGTHQSTHAHTRTQAQTVTALVGGSAVAAPAAAAATLHRTRCALWPLVCRALLACRVERLR